MNCSELKTILNPVQYKAATHTEGALLIIAGAGSGKTHTTTCRIAYMLSQGIKEENILALTFTNKAAAEMKERVERILKKKAKNLKILTFHAFGLLLLKQNAKKLGYKSKFSIYDTGDKIDLLQEVSESLNLSYSSSDLHIIAHLFSQIKTQQQSWSQETRVYQPLFNEYESFLKLYNAFDFDDLISKTLFLLKNFPDILEGYQKKFTHILVDEFQDTSLQQYDLLTLLSRPQNNLCCVGDDDQSIYSWRGANFQNILNLERDFPNLKEIKLEQNYRSTQLILQAANAVISHNHKRKDKSLWSSLDKGKSIALFRPKDDKEEAFFISQKIQWLVLQEGITYQNIAILVRTNSLFREIELALRSIGVDYHISGGSSFFQKKEIKDVIAYLRIMTNPDDDFSLLRIINTPRRGIGKESLELIKKVSEQKFQSLYESIKTLLFNSEAISLTAKSLESLQEFVAFIEEYEYQFSFSQESYSSILKNFLGDMGYYIYCLNESASEAQGQYRLKNLEFFLKIISRWESKRERDDRDLNVFLNMISLQTREEDQGEGMVSLSTIHASKGLEWDIVFLAGVEEGILPHGKTLEEDLEASLEEERRLFYVALTRARERVILTAVQERRKNKDTLESSLSRFVEEIPSDLIEEEMDDEEIIDEKEISSLWENFYQKRAAKEPNNGQKAQY